MKNFTSLLTLLFCFTYFSFTAQSQDCNQATAQVDLDVNNCKVRLLNGGDFWWDGASGQYIWPNSGNGLPEVSAMYAGALWVGGFDLAGNLKVAGKTYGTSSGNTDFWPGPLTDFGTTEPEDCQNWDRFFSIHSEHINAHIADWDDNGQIDGNVHPEVLGWPGIGNPHFEDIYGFALPTTPGGLAPFFDENQDGIYDPMDGDVPFIHCGDQGHWWVFNDNGGVHTSTTNSTAMQFEFQMLAYAFSNSGPLDNTTFYDLKFINRAIEAIDSLQIGLWIDPDLGCYTDDYIGSYPEEDLIFFYNEDATDGTTGCTCDAGINTYCEEIPVVGIKIIEGPKDEDGNPTGLSSFNYYNNSGIGTPPPGTGDPNFALEYYNLLTGSNTDGSPQFTPTGEFTKFAFAGNPGSTSDTDYTMCDNDLPFGDRRVIMGCQSRRLNPGESNSIRYAVVIEPDVAHPCPDISGLITSANEIANVECAMSVNTETITYDAPTLSLFPNPMTNQAVLRLSDLSDKLETCEIYSIDGKLVRQYSQINDSNLTINKDELGAGMYIYKTRTASGLLGSGKLIVQ